MNVLVSFLALAALADAMPEGPALHQSIAARDAEFFELVFVGCDAKRLATMLTDDFEMYHDRGGLVATSAAPFVEQYAKDCVKRSQPEEWRSRRELVAGTLKVWPVPGFGAIEDGEHVFYERKGDGPEKKVGRARFTQAWKWTPDGWRLARVFSYDHSKIE
jgi:hypothetical protein